MEKILIDTNILLYAIKIKADLFEMLRSYEIVIPDLVFAELGMLTKVAKKKSDRDAAKAALSLLQTKIFEKPKLKGKTDEAIIDYAYKNNAAILTADKELELKAKEKGLKVLFLKKKRIIEI
ncbi:MAG: PIN domain-containing protein [Candidatus Nanoarchaeia archaeon]